MTTISLRIDFGTGVDARIGPGKIALLEAVAKHKSISAATRELGMSYRRGWLLLDAMNRLFHSPVIATATGGQRGGGAELTLVGQQVLQTYRDVQVAASLAGSAGLKSLSSLVGTPAARAMKPEKKVRAAARVRR
jgi:molybdate transport system regulatory protein